MFYQLSYPSLPIHTSATAAQRGGRVDLDVYNDPVQKTEILSSTLLWKILRQFHASYTPNVFPPDIHFNIAVSYKYWSFSGFFPKGFAIKILCAMITLVRRGRNCYVIRNWMVLMYLQCLTWSSVVHLHLHYVPWCSELSAVRCQWKQPLWLQV